MEKTFSPLFITIAGGLIVALIWAAIGGFLKWRKLKSDEGKICEFLKKKKSEEGYSFLSTHIISSDTHLSEDRIREIGGKTKKFRRNQRDKESWTLKS